MGSKVSPIAIRYKINQRRGSANLKLSTLLTWLLTPARQKYARLYALPSTEPLANKDPEPVLSFQLSFGRERLKLQKTLLL